MLSNDDVKHIAKLARLSLTEDEVDKFGKQLSAILDHAKMLEKVDTSDVEPIAQVTDLKSVTFKDEVDACENPDALLEQSPQSKQDHMIKVKSVF